MYASKKKIKYIYIYIYIYSAKIARISVLNLRWDPKADSITASNSCV